MQFVILSLLSLAALGIVAALATVLTKGGTDQPIVEAHDCSSCQSHADGQCKISCLLHEKKKQEDAGEDTKD